MYHVNIISATTNNKTTIPYKWSQNYITFWLNKQSFLLLCYALVATLLIYSKQCEIDIDDVILIGNIHIVFNVYLN